MIGIVDYKTANIGSIVNMFKRIGARTVVAETPDQLADATHILLPGIGRFDVCAANLARLGFVDALHEAVMMNGKPLLGICVGAQLLTRGSEEGDRPGLGWIAAETRRFRRQKDCDIKIPHMGWNVVEARQSHPLFSGFEAAPRFYFVHSYYMNCDDSETILGQTVHGIEFESAITNGTVSGLQFHPEKSHVFGMQLLRNFAALASPMSGSA